MIVKKLPKMKIIKKKDKVLEDSDSDEDTYQNEVNFEEPYKIGDFVIVIYEGEEIYYSLVLLTIQVLHQLLLM